MLTRLPLRSVQVGLKALDRLCDDMTVGIWGWSNDNLNKLRSAELIFDNTRASFVNSDLPRRYYDHEMVVKL